MSNNFELNSSPPQTGNIDLNLLPDTDSPKVTETSQYKNLFDINSVSHQCLDELKVFLRTREESKELDIHDDPSIVINHLSVNLSNSAEESMVFHAEFKDATGNVVLKEKAETINTASIRIEGLKEKLAFLEGKLSDPDQTAEETHYLLNQINDLSNELIQAEKNIGQATWASTNSPRYLFKNNSHEEARNDQANLVTNLRVQTVEDADGNVLSTSTRSGAIYDTSHAETNVKEMQEYKQNPTAEAKKQLILAYGNNILTDPISDEQLAKLRKKESFFGEVLREIKTLFGDKKKDPFQDLQIDEKKLQLLIDKRLDKLQTLALQDLYAHLNAKKITADDQKQGLLYGRIGLLDLTKSPSTVFGAELSEKTMGLDMSALFDSLDGKEILFTDTKAPFIADGKIYMPKSCAEEGVDKVIISSYFFNISGQGNTLNTGLQKEINDKALKKMQDRGVDIKDIEHDLTLLSQGSKMDSFETSVKLANTIQNAKGRVGINCYGGKDRTGYVLARMTSTHLPKENIKQKNKWYKQLLAKDNIASKIAQQNANHKVLTVSRFDLELYDTKSFKGKLSRTVDMMGAIKKMANSKVFAITSGKAGKISETNNPTQLHYKAIKIS